MTPRAYYLSLSKVATIEVSVHVERGLKEHVVGWKNSVFKITLFLLFSIGYKPTSCSYGDN